MIFQEYISRLPTNKKLSEVKLIILKRLWAKDQDTFPKPWVSSDELLKLTGQKYFDRRTRELRDQMGCDLESTYQEKFSGHAWRIKSSNLAPPQDRNYLTQAQKVKMFAQSNYCCAICKVKTDPGIRGLQADHKVPISRGGSNSLENWQPLCNSCNVGKRRACEGCKLDCKTCSWAFPEIVGVNTMVSISEEVLKQISIYSNNSGEATNKIMEDAAKYYLDKKGG